MKHQYEALGSMEQGEAIPLERPAERSATPDTLVNENHNENQGSAEPTTSTSTSTTNGIDPSTGMIELPNDLASVAIVRKYITDILHGHYDVPWQEAESAAARWHGALGYRFRQMTHQDLESLLGEQYADMIKDYRDAVDRHKKAEQRRGRIIALVIFLIWAALMALIVGAIITDRK